MVRVTDHYLREPKSRPQKAERLALKNRTNKTRANMRRSGLASLICELLLRMFLFGIFLISETLTPFHRVIHPEEMWLYKNPRSERDMVPTWHMFAISFLTPLMVILLMKVLNRSESGDVKEGFLAASLGLVLNGVITNSLKLVIGRPRPDYFYRCFPDGVVTEDVQCTGDPAGITEGRKSFPSGHSSCNCICRPWFYCLLFGRETPLFRVTGPRKRLEAVCDANAPLHCSHCCSITCLRLQAPLARCGVRLSDRINYFVHLLSPALPTPVGP
ncbi:phospholipid phosphatase 4-like isoform X3 [Narcine bancroftii]|uniref:phospholipid phosphatase 4-like isoform X3 n=1 Tax=Narcine bancroftii TaxID=1343680 RepID=UPI003831B7C5